MVARAGQLLFGQIDAHHLPGPILTSPSAEPTETAAEIDDPESLHVGQHDSQRRPFDRTVQTFYGTAEFAVAVEEIGPVVDVLRHACAFRSPTDKASRRIPSFQDRPATASRHPIAAATVIRHRRIVVANPCCIAGSDNLGSPSTHHPLRRKSDTFRNRLLGGRICNAEALLKLGEA